MFEIEYDLTNLKKILKRAVEIEDYCFIEFINSNKKSKLKKPKKKNILKLKKRLERIENIHEIKFKNCLVYKELIFICENLKQYSLNFKNCTLEEGTKKEMLKFMKNCGCVTLTVSKKMDKSLFYAIKKYFCKVKDKDLQLTSFEYKSIKIYFLECI